MRLLLTRRHSRLETLAAKLSQLSPLRILERGYAIVTNERGAIVKRSVEAPAGAQLRIRLAEGRLGALVTESKYAQTFRSQWFSAGHRLGR